MKILLLLSLLLPCAALPAAAEMRLFDGTALSEGLRPGTPPPAATPAASPRGGADFAPLPQKDYTVMLFMNGKNNLGQMMVRKLVELERLGSDSRVNFVMQLGITKLSTTSCSGGACTYPYGADWEGVRRYYALKTQGPNKGIEASVRMADPANQDMGDYKALVDFALWAKRLMPARHYILVVGNHGGAWVDRMKKAEPATNNKGVSYDDVTHNYITTPEIGQALRELGGAEILIFDDCLMQAAEVASEVGTAADYIAGSEEISYTNHFKPDLYFGPLKKDPSMDPSQFMYAYDKLYSAYLGKLWQQYKKYPGTASVMFTVSIDGFNGLVARYAAAAKELAETDPAAKAAYREAMKEVLRFDYKYCADLHDFLRLSGAKLAASPSAGTDKVRRVNALGAELSEYISRQLTPYSVGVGTATDRDYSRARGVSVYIPYMKAGTENDAQPVFLAPANLQTKYADLAFEKATGWQAFVRALIKK